MAGIHDDRPITKDAVEAACQKAHRLPVCLNLSSHIRFGAHSLYIPSNQVPNCGPFSSSSVIAVSPPRPSTCASRPTRSERRPALWTSCHIQFQPNHSRRHQNTSEFQTDGPLGVGSGGHILPLRCGLSWEPRRFAMCIAQRRFISALELCRTAALGRHVERCDHCDHQCICYNRCRDRHCQKCQSLAHAQWLDERRSELLNTQYFHVVFTIPQSIAAIALQIKEIVYGILFRATSETLRTIAADSKHLDAQNRILRGASYLGSGSFSPSASALRDSAGHFSGWHVTDFLPAQVLFPVLVRLSRRGIRLFTRSAPSPDLNKSSSTSHDTRTVSLSPTIASSISITPRFSFLLERLSQWPPLKVGPLSRPFCTFALYLWQMEATGIRIRRGFAGAVDSRPAEALADAGQARA